ncbi:MAG TPA: GyrI-like domain-containing protein [Ohtaekwangia sp.]|nr:GyrI-like domain-containing protein [Ohtaekwangia sp.]
MEIKEVKPINFLFFRTAAKVSELVNFLDVARDHFREAVQYDLRVTGPVHWHYIGFTDLQQLFTLEIALPVADILQEYDGAFHFKRTEPFRCVSTLHEGDWLTIPKSYNELAKFMQDNNVTPTAVNRELYINADFRFPEANVTEIQMGIH